jgi:hypothetical protein
MDEKQPNEFGKAMQEWWDSDACKQLQKSHKEGVERAVGKYFILSEEDKLDMVQAICYIMCKAEQEGTSHRGLQDALGIYPSGFWCDFLIDTHNALYEYYNKQRQKQELEEDIETLKSFMNKKDD